MLTCGPSYMLAVLTYWALALIGPEAGKLATLTLEQF